MEKEIFKALVEQYQHKVFHTCFVMLHNREDAEDVAQETFVELYRSLDSFKGEANISTFLYKIAINCCMDFIRMKGRKKRNLFAFRSLSPYDIEQLQVRDTVDPHKILEEKNRSEILYKAIDQLPERQKIAFSLAKIEGLKQEDIAGIMETTVSSVESLLTRANKHLRVIISKNINVL